MRRKFIGTARGCGGLRGKCDQVGACELLGARGPGGARWKGRVAQKRRVLLPPQQHNSALLCCTETESEQADLHIANSHHYVFNKAAAVRLRKVLNKAAFNDCTGHRGNLGIPGKEAGTRHCFSTIGLKLLK